MLGLKLHLSIHFPVLCIDLSAWNGYDIVLRLSNSFTTTNGNTVKLLFVSEFGIISTISKITVYLWGSLTVFFTKGLFLYKLLLTLL